MKREDILDEVGTQTGGRSPTLGHTRDPGLGELSEALSEEYITRLWCPNWVGFPCEARVVWAHHGVSTCIHTRLSTKTHKSLRKCVHTGETQMSQGWV